MEEREAIRELEWAKNRLMQNSHMDNNRIMAFNMAFSALEKQIAKKAKVKKYSFYPHSTLIRSIYGKCPNCGTVQVDDRYCANCGQKLDWEEAENKGN